MLEAEFEDESCETIIPVKQEGKEVLICNSREEFYNLNGQYGIAKKASELKIPGLIPEYWLCKPKKGNIQPGRNYNLGYQLLMHS